MSLYFSGWADRDENNTSSQKGPDLKLSPLKSVSPLQAIYLEGDFFVYTGKIIIYNPDIAVHQPIGSKIICTLVKLFFDKGYCICMDNLKSFALTLIIMPQKCMCFWLRLLIWPMDPKLYLERS